MIAPDLTQTVLKGRTRNTEGEWVWCSILPRDWSPILVELFCEIGVFDWEGGSETCGALPQPIVEHSPPTVVPLSKNGSPLKSNDGRGGATIVRLKSRNPTFATTRRHHCPNGYHKSGGLDGGGDDNLTWGAG